MPMGEVLPMIIGLASRGELEAAAKLNSTDPAALKVLIGANPYWTSPQNGELVYTPASRSIVAPCNSGDIQISARTQKFNFWACVTARPLADILDRDFFANVAVSFERFDRIEVTCLADLVQPWHGTLVVVGIDKSHRSVAVEILREASA
jgi:hypothetical protein